MLLNAEKYQGDSFYLFSGQVLAGQELRQAKLM